MGSHAVLQVVLSASPFFAVLLVTAVIPISALSLMPVARAQSNLVANGTFESDLAGTWTIYRVTIADPYPIVRRDKESNGKYYLYFDTPYPTEAYVQQGPIIIPSSQKVLLSFTEWGRYQPSEVSIEVVDGTGNKRIIDDFYTEGLLQLNGARITKIYDFTEFTGQSISLRFRVKSPFNSGTITGIDDVRLTVGDSSHPLITCGIARQEAGSLPENNVQPGQNITVSGQTYPPSAIPLTILYTSPNGTLAGQEVTSTKDGTFSEDFTPSMSGIWMVSVSPAQFASSNYVGSCDSQFVVRGSAGIEPLQILVNGRPINSSNPVIEVKPGESISGTVRVSLLDNLRFTNLVVIGFDSWEPKAWDLVMYGQGLEGDPTGLGWKYGLVPEPSRYDVILVPRDKSLGSYVFNISWSFPLSQDIGNEIQQNGFHLIAPHPSMKAPSAPGQYYLVLMQAWVSSAAELVQDTHAFTRSDWQKYVPPSRNATYILAIVVVVVDVDSHLNAARNEIACASSYNANTGIAEADYSKAIELASVGHYNASASMADEALVAATASVARFQNEINRNKVATLYYVSENFVSIGNRNRISSEYDQFNSLLEGREYCQARQLQDDITNLASFDILTFILYFLFLVFGVGDLAAHFVKKRDPASVIEERMNKALGRKLKAVQGPLAGFATYGMITLVLSLLYSPFPIGGLLILTVGVGLGWELNKTEKLARRLWIMLKGINAKITR